MKLDEYILSHKQVGATDFYDKVVGTQNAKFGRYKFSEGATKVLCPFHEDSSPSMGFFNAKQDGREILHCFACGYSGDVFKVYADLSDVLKGRKIDKNTAYKGVAAFYNVPLDETSLNKYKEEKSKYGYDELDNLPKYTLTDFNFDVAFARESIKDTQTFSEVWASLREKVEYL